MSPYVVLHAPGLEAMAQTLAEQMGSAEPLCTADIGKCTPDAEDGSNSTAVFWDTFPSASGEKDPNVKVMHSKLVDKHVVLLLSQDDTSNSFAQLSLVLWLQRFIVPNPDEKYAAGKWKDTVPDGAYTAASVASLSIVIPWYRYCQMERTSRWTRTGDDKKPWANNLPSGMWLDVPTAQTYASLLSADPPPLLDAAIPAPPIPPKRLLLIDLHDDLKGLPVLERTLTASGKWANPPKPYDLPTGAGTYFASAFHVFLTTTYRAAVADLAKVSIVFPDVGAYRRFNEMVKVCLSGLSEEQVLFIEKSRVGTAVTQSEVLNYFDKAGNKVQKQALPDGAQVLVPDDFTNSGSTLFGAGTIIRKHSGGTMSVAAFVTHFVAKYDKKVVDAFVQKLYSEGGNASDLDHFYTTDTVACSAAWLQAEVAKRDGPSRCTVTSVAPVIAGWLKESGVPAPSPVPSLSPLSMIPCMSPRK